MDYLLHFIGLLFIPFMLFQITRGLGDIFRGLSPLLSRQASRVRNSFAAGGLPPRVNFAVEN